MRAPCHHLSFILRELSKSFLSFQYHQFGPGSALSDQMAECSPAYWGTMVQYRLWLGLSLRVGKITINVGIYPSLWMWCLWGSSAIRKSFATLPLLLTNHFKPFITAQHSTAQQENYTAACILRDYTYNGNSYPREPLVQEQSLCLKLHRRPSRAPTSKEICRWYLTPPRLFQPPNTISNLHGCQNRSSCSIRHQFR